MICSVVEEIGAEKHRHPHVDLSLNGEDIEWCPRDQYTEVFFRNGLRVCYNSSIDIRGAIFFRVYRDGKSISVFRILDCTEDTIIDTIRAIYRGPTSYACSVVADSLTILDIPSIASPAWISVEDKKIYFSSPEDLLRYEMSR